MHPIYIPSKGRSNLVRGAIEMLNSAGIAYTVVVEPQELELYRQRNIPTLAVLDRNNGGLGYAREAIKQMSISAGEKWHWQINDDIYKFILRRQGEKTLDMTPADAILEMEAEVHGYINIGLAGPEENTWPPGDPMRINGMPGQMLLIRNEVNAAFETCPGFDDIDYMLQVLREGYCSIQFNNIRIIAPTPGTNVGGDYGAKRDFWLKKHLAKWPNIVFNPGGSPGGRPSRRFIMKQFAQRPIQTPPPRKGIVCQQQPTGRK